MYKIGLVDKKDNLGWEGPLEGNASPLCIYSISMKSFWTLPGMSDNNCLSYMIASYFTMFHMFSVSYRERNNIEGLSRA